MCVGGFIWGESDGRGRRQREVCNVAKESIYNAVWYDALWGHKSFTNDPGYDGPYKSNHPDGY